MQRPDGPRSKPCAWLKEVGVRAQHNVISKSLLSECVGWTNEQPEPVVNTGVGRTLLFSRTLMSDFLGSTPTFIVHQAFDPHREPSCVTWALTPGCISILWPPPALFAGQGAWWCCHLPSTGAVTHTEVPLGVERRREPKWLHRKGCTIPPRPGGRFSPSRRECALPALRNLPARARGSARPHRGCKRKCSVAAPGGIRRGRCWH